MPDEVKLIEDKASHVIAEWEEYARKGNWTVKGYQMVEAPSGPSKVGEGKKEQYMIIYRPHGVLYHHSYGLVSKFFKGLLDEKLLGTRCPQCQTVYCPPRVHCWNPRCKAALTEWQELPLRGTVHTFSVMLFSADAFLEQLPFVLGYVQIDETHTALPIQVITAPTEVFIGQRVEIRFRDKRKGDLMDVYAVPLPGQTIPDYSCLHSEKKNLRDMERDLENTYSFLEKKFGLKKEQVQQRWQQVR